VTCKDCYSYPCEKVGTACYNAIRKEGWDEVLDNLISHYKKVIEDGKGVTYNHPIDYQWMYGGVVKYLEELRQGKVGEEE
jgi:hypothetical protein